MGKVPKAVKTVNKIEKKPKVKKLLNNPGVSKTSAKLNLKDARVAPLQKILKNKSEADRNDILTKDVKPLKNKKNLLKPVGDPEPQKNKKTLSIKAKNTIKPKLNSSVEQVSLMKTLKRKSSSDNSVKLPLPKKKVNPPNVPIKKQTTKKVIEELQSKKTQEVPKTENPKVEKKIPKQTSEKKPSTAIDKSQVLEGVSAILKLAKLQAESKKKLFNAEHQPIFLQVSCIKIPKVPRRQLRIMLPNTLVTDTDDVVLFVGDLKKGRAQDFEPTINHYKDLLEKHGCTQIKDVIPLTQVKTEYDQFELKRKLLSSYDYFLTDGKIAGHLSHLLGKIFITKRKLPTSIKIDSKNLKLEIDNALRKTSMQLHSQGNSNIVQIAHTGMKKQKILNNVLNTCKNLANNYPGGWANIRSLMLKTPTGLPVPIYFTLKSKNKVKVPVVVSKRPKAHHIVSGELSTAPGNSRVVVKPDGTVTVHQYKDNKKVGESAAKKSTLTAAKFATNKSVQKEKKTAVIGVVKENVKTKKNEPRAVTLKRKIEEPKANSKTKTKTRKAEDSEDEIEEAEQAYLNQWQKESSTTEEKSTKTSGKTEEKQLKKKSKIVKKKKNQGVKLNDK